MVYKRPEHNPQPDDGHHGKGWNPGEPSWGNPNNPFGQENFSGNRSPKKVQPPVAPKPPAHRQLNLFDANGIDVSQFELPLWARKRSQEPLPDRAPKLDGSKYKQRNLFEDNNFGYNHIDPSLLPSKRQEQYSHYAIAGYLQTPLNTPATEEPSLSRRRRAPEPNKPLELDDLRRELPKHRLSTDGYATDPTGGRMSRAERDQRQRDGTLPSGDKHLEGLALRDYLEAHPEVQVGENPNLEKLMAQAHAFKAQQAQTQTQSGFPSQGVKVASTHLNQMHLDPGQTDPSYAPVRKPSPAPLTPEQQLHRKFETDVATHAQSLLKANKDRLNSEQTQYAQDKNPNSDRWQKLWQAADQRREFQRKEATAQTNYNYANHQIEALMASPNDFNPMASAEQRRKDAQQKATLIADYQHLRAVSQTQIEQARQNQVTLTYAYPALAAVQNESGNNPKDIQTVQSRIPGEFDGIRGNIDKLSAEMVKDPTTATLFDSVVQQSLHQVPPEQRPQVMTWLKTQRENKERNTQIGALASGGLMLASLFPVGRLTATGLRMVGIGLGGGVAAAQMPDLMLLDTAAQAGRGGTPLANQSPEQAKFNLVMGYANVGLAGLDVGAEVGVVQKLGHVAISAAQTGVQVSREKWGQVLSWARQGPAGMEKARALLAEVKGLPQAIKDEILDIVSPVEMAGYGRVSRRDIREQEPLQSTTTARGSGKAKALKDKDLPPAERLAKAKKNYGQARNWDAIEPLIGTAIDKYTKLPSGYRLFQKPGSKQLFILRETADDGSFAPLMIESGKIQVGKTRLSRGRKGMEDALKAIGIDTPKGYQLNHLVPDAVAQSDPMVVEMLKRNIYDVDHAGNLLPMPGEVRGSHPDLIGHLGSHDNYNKLVSRDLKQRARDLIQEHGSLSKVPDNELKQAVEDIENNMRDGIINRSPDIPTRYDPETKTRVLSEGLSNPDFVA
jgi:A nuclease family of the HNH/ENDO VII superfamily with conserved AHH